VGEPVVAPTGAPRLGADTDDVLGTLLGIEQAELEILRTQGIV
jgi:crotonobetainyl-CoA:carnitine CoA-transferase CaiB-like acyl-CoA transferase